MVLTVYLSRLFVAFYSYVCPTIKKAHPEGCAEKVFPRKVATLTISHTELEENTFYQSDFPRMRVFIQLVSRAYFTIYSTKSKVQKVGTPTEAVDVLKALILCGFSLT